MAKTTQTKKSEVICRERKKNRGFTINDNISTDDMNLSIEAMAVHHIFKRWVSFEAEDFVCSKSFIQSKSRMGEKRFERVWRELKEQGYIKMYCVGKSNWSAELLDEPEPETPHTYYLNNAGEVKRTVGGDDKIEENPNPPQNGGDLEKPDLNPPHLRGDLASGDLASGGLAKGNNINTINKNSFNNNFNNNQSINHIEEEPKVIPAQTSKTKMDRVIDEEVIKDIQEQISYDSLKEQFDIEMLDTAVSCIADLYAVSEPQEFSGNTYAPEFIRQRSLQINSMHIQYVFECFQQQRDKVYNIRKYLRSAIFNAPDTYGAYYENAVRVKGLVW